MVVVSPPSRSLPLSHSPSPSASSSSSSPSISSSIVYSSNGRHGSRLRIVSGIGVKPHGSLDPKEGRNVSLNLSGGGGGGHGMGSIEENQERWIGGDGGRRRMRRKRRVVMMCSAGLEGIGERRRELAAREEGFVIPERAKVMAMVAMVLCLCNADRVVMSVAIVPLASRYGWSSSVLGIIQSSFLWGYLFSSVVGGALADRYGGKRVLACGVALWSLATFLTPWAADHSTAMLLVVRAFFGLAEGVAFPCMSTLLFRWFPGHERASAVGISMAGFHLGNVISFLVSPILLSRIGVNGSFSFFASLGFIWLSSWLFGITNDPRDSPHISQSELQLIRAGKIDSKGEACKLPSLQELLSKLPSLAVIFANVANNWGYFVLLSWMPVYFKTVYNVNLKQAAWFSAVPWGVMALSSYIAGASSDFLIKSGYPVARVRKIMQSIGFIGPAVSLLCLKYAQTPTVAAVLMTIALSLSSFSQAGYFLNIQDIAPKCAGFLHGITNSAGTFAAIISTIGAGYFVQWLGSFEAFLMLTAAIYFITTIFFNRYAIAEQVFF